MHAWERRAEMKWLGLALLVPGAVVALVCGFLNAQTPIQVGPVPVISGSVAALVGLILFLSHI